MTNKTCNVEQCRSAIVDQIQQAGVSDMHVAPTLLKALGFMNEDSTALSWITSTHYSPEGEDYTGITQLKRLSQKLGCSGMQGTFCCLSDYIPLHARVTQGVVDTEPDVPSDQHSRALAVR